MQKNKIKLFPDKIVPIVLTVVIFLVVSLFLYLEIKLLNKFGTTSTHILTRLNLSDIIIGLTIYLKTSIDFTIFIGRLMKTYPGWKNRIMIEIGTALGNALGTLIILLLWNFFREIRPLLFVMIILAALVLLRLAQDGLEHVKDENGKYKINFGGVEIWLEKILLLINNATKPLLGKIVPNFSMKDKTGRTYLSLFFFSLTVPFILGLDDFAGYVPLFNIVNVFGFSVGVFLGHMLLNLFLFISPKRTTDIIDNPLISFFGSIAFVGIAIWGIFEAIKLLGI